MPPAACSFATGVFSTSPRIKPYLQCTAVVYLWCAGRRRVETQIANPLGHLPPSSAALSRRPFILSTAVANKLDRMKGAECCTSGHGPQPVSAHTSCFFLVREKDAACFRRACAYQSRLDKQPWSHGFAFDVRLGVSADLLQLLFAAAAFGSPSRLLEVCIFSNLSRFCPQSGAIPAAVCGQQSNRTCPRFAVQSLALRFPTSTRMSLRIMRLYNSVAQLLRTPIS